MQTGTRGTWCRVGIATGRQPAFSTCHRKYLVALTIFYGEERIINDLLYRGSSLSAGSSVCRHCSAKTFTVAPDLEAAGGGMEEQGGTYVAATGVRNALRQVRTNRNLESVKR